LGRLYLGNALARSRLAGAHRYVVAALFLAFSDLLFCMPVGTVSGSRPEEELT
jgi:hypothetical protein